MKKEKIKKISIQEFAQEAEINYEVLKIKQKLVAKIKKHCAKNEISQRSLAKLVPGLTQDRVSKLFNDRIGGMTIDKLIQILSTLNIQVNVSLKNAA